MTWCHSLQDMDPTWVGSLRGWINIGGFQTSLIATAEVLVPTPTKGQIFSTCEEFNNL